MIVTHEARAASYADRVLFLADGLIVRDLGRTSAGEVLARDGRAQPRVTKFALKGLLGRKLRTALTCIAIVLGVAMVTGTYILTDSIKGAFGGIFTEIYSGTDATITGKSAFDLTDQNNTTAPPFDESLLDKVRDLPDVADAVGGVGGEAHLIGRNGKVIVFGGAPNLGFSVDPARPAFNTLTLIDGSWPFANEVVIDQSTAKKKDLKVGQTIGVQANGPVQQMRISGLVKFGGAASLGGATLAGFDLETGQKLFQKPGKLDQIRAKAKPGITPQQLAQRDPEHPAAGHAGAHRRGAGAGGREGHGELPQLPPGLPAGVRRHRAVRRQLRDRELAVDHDRAAHARARDAAHARRVAPSGAGLDHGRVARDRAPLVDRRHPRRPRARHGTVQAVRRRRLHAAEQRARAAHAHDRRRDARRRPRHARREPSPRLPLDARAADRGRAGGRDAAAGSRFARFRLPAAIAADARSASRRSPTGSSGRISARRRFSLYMGLGTLLLFFGTALLSSRFARPLARLLGWPATKIGGAAGALARDNAQRNPQRTASTASALMIGLALVTVVAVLAAGITKSFKGAVNDLWTSGYAVTAVNNFSPIPIAAGDAAGKTPGVEAIANVRAGDAAVFGHVIQATAVNPESVGIFNLKWTDGSEQVLGNLGAHGAFVDNDYAKTHNLEVGSPLTLTSPNGRAASARGARHLRPADGRLAVRAASRSRTPPGTRSTTSRRTSTRSCR